MSKKNLANFTRTIKDKYEFDIETSESGHIIIALDVTNESHNKNDLKKLIHTLKANLNKNQPSTVQEMIVKKESGVIADKLIECYTANNGTNQVEIPVDIINVQNPDIKVEKKVDPEMSDQEVSLSKKERKAVEKEKKKLEKQKKKELKLLEKAKKKQERLDKKNNRKTQENSLSEEHLTPDTDKRNETPTKSQQKEYFESPNEMRKRETADTSTSRVSFDDRRMDTTNRENLIARGEKSINKTKSFNSLVRQNKKDKSPKKVKTKKEKAEKTKKGSKNKFHVHYSLEPKSGHGRVFRRHKPSIYNDESSSDKLHKEKKLRDKHRLRDQRITRNSKYYSSDRLICSGSLQTFNSKLL